MRKPNFFILGAPKCGTTSLAHYLAEHPRVYMNPNFKEPYFFNSYLDDPALEDEDFRHVTRVHSMDEYLKIFSWATSDHKAIGEATVWHLYSKVAPRRILEFNPDARAIVMLRNPVDLAHSMHSQLQFILDEDEPDFERAWRLQDDRKQGRNIPEECRVRCQLYYKDLALLGQQVERLLEVFPRDQVYFIFMDDFAKNTQREYETVLDFLGVPSDGRTEFPPVWPNRTSRSKFVSRLTMRPPRVWTGTAKAIRSVLNIERIGITHWLMNVNARYEKRAPMRPEFRAQLVEAFRDDVELLGRLCARDLSHWLESPVASAT